MTIIKLTYKLLLADTDNVGTSCLRRSFDYVAGLVSSGDAAVLLDEPGLGRHDNDVQLQLASSQLLQVWTRRRSRGKSKSRESISFVVTLLQNVTTKLMLSVDFDAIILAYFITFVARADNGHCHNGQSSPLVRVQFRWHRLTRVASNLVRITITVVYGGKRKSVHFIEL